jgi:hypothetical protein
MRKLAALAVLATVVFACENPRKSRAAASSSEDEGLKVGELVFTDDFERKELGPNYESEGGAWAIKEGRVHISGAHNEGLWLSRQVPRDARIEFDAIAHSADGDIKCEVFAKEPRHQAGYVLIFGGWKNRLNVIARLDEHGDDRREVDKPKAVMGKVHKMVITRKGGRLRHYVDGLEVISFDDAEPLSGRFFGFNDWEAPVSFDNLRVYKLK